VKTSCRRYLTEEWSDWFCPAQCASANFGRFGTGINAVEWTKKH